MWHLMAWVSLLGVVAGWIMITGLGDRVWWALPILFGPRWLWLLFVGGIVPCIVVTPRRGVPLAVVAALIATFGIMDWRLGLGRFVRASGVQVWVMTLNAGAGSSIPQSPRILDEIRRVDADVVVITECGASLPAALQTMSATYSVRIAKETSNCLLAKGTITGWWERDPTDAFKQNGSGAIQRAEVLLPQGAVRLGLVHLATPRQALQEFRDISQIPSLGELTRRNTVEREEESEHAVEWIDRGAPMPLIIAGDFNLPIESAIYWRNWSRFRNAFSEVGWGPGYTKHTRWWGIRIDHVLSSIDVRPLQSYVGHDVGSDHLPLIASLALPAGPAGSTR
jgi:endonuclease/exonuclease/phosphatase (EEP) superfamily protein YafD